MTDIDTTDGGEGDGDELALPRFEERLRLRLAAAHRAHTAANGHDPVAAGDPDGGWGGGPVTVAGAAADGRRERDPRLRDGNRRQRRAARRSLRVGVGGLAAAAAVAVVVAAITRDPAPAGDDTADVAGGPISPTGPASPDDLVTRIISATQEAEATMIVHVTQDNTSYGDDDQWYDETTGASRFVQHYESGGPAMDSSSAGEASVIVDHCFSEYVEGTSLPVGPGSATGWVQRGLEGGSMVEEGTEVVDGRELIRLVERASNVAVPEPGPDDTIILPAPGGDPATHAEAQADPEAEARAAEEQAAAEQAAHAGPPTTATAADEVLGVTLVDPETYRPVRRVGYPGSDAEYVQHFEYLPRTPENLANLEAEVPAGFTPVDQLRGDGERFDAGCV